MYNGNENQDDVSRRMSKRLMATEWIVVFEKLVLYGKLKKMKYISITESLKISYVNIQGIHVVSLITHTAGCLVIHSQKNYFYIFTTRQFSMYRIVVRHHVYSL